MGSGASQEAGVVEPLQQTGDPPQKPRELSKAEKMKRGQQLVRKASMKAKTDVTSALQVMPMCWEM